MLPSNSSQRAYQGCRLRIGLIMWPAKQFLGERTSAPETFARTPKKNFATDSRSETDMPIYGRHVRPALRGVGTLVRRHLLLSEPVRRAFSPAPDAID